MSTEQLVQRFAEIGIAQDEAIWDDAHQRYNRLFAEMNQIEDELRSRKSEAREALLRLYSHPNIQVRLKAAVRTLAVAPHRARWLLEEIAARKDVPQGGDAGMTITALDDRTFKPT